MHYDKNIYRKQYGNIYFKMMYWGLGFTLLFMQIAWYPHFFGIQVPMLLIECSTTLCVLCLIIGVGIGGYFYFDGKRLAKQQQQWIDKKKIYYRIEKRKVLSLRNNEMHTYTYFVRQLENLQITRRYIICKGIVSVTDEHDDKKNTFTINELKIPRTFSNEENFLNAIRYKKK